MKCKFCRFETNSTRGMIIHLNNKVQKLLKDKRRDILIAIGVGLIVSILSYFWVIPSLDKPIIPNFILNVTLDKNKLTPNNLYFDKEIYWKEEYQYYDIEIHSSKTKITDALFIIHLNKSIFGFEVDSGLSECEFLFPKSFTYVINNTTHTGEMSEFDYSNGDMNISWGSEHFELKCADLGMIGYFKFRVFTSETAGYYKDFNDTYAFGYYEGVRNKPTIVFADIGFNT